jgi:hypothetical protein
MSSSGPILDLATVGEVAAVFHSQKDIDSRSMRSCCRVSIVPKLMSSIALINCDRNPRTLG